MNVQSITNQFNAIEAKIEKIEKDVDYCLDLLDKITSILNKTQKAALAKAIIEEENKDGQS